MVFRERNRSIVCLVERFPICIIWNGSARGVAHHVARNVTSRKGVEQSDDPKSPDSDLGKIPLHSNPLGFKPHGFTELFDSIFAAV